MRKSNEHYDLVVIGAGPAGEKGAEKAAKYGKRVALIERAPYVGGAGINTGTIPSKTLRESALYFSGLRQRGLYGIDYSLRENLSIRDFMYRERLVVKKEREIIGQNLRNQNISIIHGFASFIDANTIHVKSGKSQQDLSGEIILIATGSSPLNPPEIPFDAKKIFDSDTILHMGHIPKTMVVVGGGVIGTEYASIFTALGVKVCLIEPRGRIVGFADSEITDRLTNQLRRLGVNFLFDRMLAIEVKGDYVRIKLERGRSAKFEVALIAAGRKSNVEGLGLEQVGVKLGQRGLVLVNEKFQTNVPNIYAVGDVIGFPALASTSMEQARVAIGNAFNLAYKERISPILPLAVYSIPEISMVGLTEDQCIQKNTPYLLGCAFYTDNARGQIIGDMSGMLKLIFSPVDRKILGAHIIGEQASELIHVASRMMMDNGTIDDLLDAVYNYPSLSGLYEQAAYDGLARYEEWIKNKPS